MKKETDVLKSQVIDVLKNVPKTRNSDITLMIIIWKRFYPKLVRPDEVPYASFYKLPNLDAISRIRRYLQNDKKKYVPTSEEVAKQRGWKKREWERYLYDEKMKVKL